MVRSVWGVDSAAPVTEKLFSCVNTNLGTPAYWGRYLSTVENVARGLTREEISFIRNKGVKVLPIYNDFNEAVGLSNGRRAARNAIYHARRLGIPKNTVIFANIEDFFKVDSAWIRGWVDAFQPSGYRPGFYQDPVEGDFNQAFCKAAQEDRKVFAQSILFSSKPRPGTSSKENTPTFNPATPDCESSTWVWQYGRDSNSCPVDTNLADSKVLKFLY